MIKGPNKFRDLTLTFGAIALIVLVIVILAVGTITAAIWAFSLLAHAHVPTITMPGWLPDLFTEKDGNGQRYLSALRIGALGTTIFTAVLVYVTWTMGNASRRQVAGDAPLLQVNLLISPIAQPAVLGQAKPPTKRETREHEVYPDALVEDDAIQFPEPPFKALQPTRMLKVRIDNVQTRPFAVARDIRITVALTFSGTERFWHGPDSSEMIFTRTLERVVEVRILEPNSAITEPIFNLAALNECEVSVTDVRYRDLRRRQTRKAAYGELTLTLKADGTIEAKDGYSRPRRWEMP